MTLSTQLTDRREASAKNLPSDIHRTMTEATRLLKESGIEEKAPKEGQLLPPFRLPNQTGEMRSLEDLLATGKVIITFYRGGWCPYCNFELRAYQEHLAVIQSTGTTLVAISPELPDQSLSTAEKNALGFEVLSDVGALYAKELGLVFELPDALRPIYTSFGIDVEKHNGTDSFELPIPATFIIGQNGKVEHAFVNADYTYRQDPETLIKLL